MGYSPQGCKESDMTEVIGHTGVGHKLTKSVKRNFFRIVIDRDLGCMY